MRHKTHLPKGAESEPEKSSDGCFDCPRSGSVLSRDCPRCRCICVLKSCFAPSYTCRPIALNLDSGNLTVKVTASTVTAMRLMHMEFRNAMTEEGHGRHVPDCSTPRSRLIAFGSKTRSMHSVSPSDKRIIHATRQLCERI